MLVVYASVLPSEAETEVVGRSLVDAERWVAESGEAYAANRYAEALPPTVELTRAFPNQQIYAQRLAVIHQHLADPVSEAAAWERVVDISPTPLDACPALPEAYTRAGRAEAAFDAYTRCAAFEANNADMIFYLARAHERAGRTDRAEAGYREAVSIDRGHSDSQLGLARLDLRAGRLPEATRASAAVLAKFPNHADALLIAGLSAQRSGRRTDARRHLDQALGTAEHYVDVHIALGVLEFEEGKTAAARRHFERAVELDPARRTEVAVWLERTGGRD